MLKRVLWLCGALLLGALGNGVWELLRPLLVDAGSAVLSVLTLGRDSLRDSVYRDSVTVTLRPVANSHLVTVASVFIVGGVLALLFQPLLPNPGQRGLARLFQVVFLVVVGISMGQATRSNYISGLALFNSRLEALAAPYMSDSEIKESRAEFVGIEGREGFIRHADRLRAIIGKAGSTPPSRDYF